MKLNKKGFMLAEVVIVASVISVVLVSIYISLNRMSMAYEMRNRYYDIDAMQVAMEINDIIKGDNSIISTNSGAISFSDDQYQSQDVDLFLQFYRATDYAIVGLYYCPYDIEYLNNISVGADRNLIDYIDYLSDGLDFSKKYDYMIIVELQKDLQDDDDIYFYTLKVGDTNEA